MPAPLLEVRDLTFAYGELPILRDLQLSIATGTATGLLGANGSGKTTLFRCITGLEKPEKGQIFLEGSLISNDFRRLRQKVGFSLQNAEDQLIFPTVIEDVSFGPLNLGLSQKEARTRAEETLALLQLSGFADRLTHQLSGGQQKLVALAGVLAMRPLLLLLDEPFNGLDEKASEVLCSVITSLDCAKLIVAHDHKLLGELCTELLLLENGKLKPAAALGNGPQS